MLLNTYRYLGQYPPTAVQLAERLGATIICTDTPPATEPVVNWGKNVALPSPNILNANAPINKAEAFRLLEEGNVPVPRFITGPYITRAIRHRGGNDIRRYTGERRFVVEEINKQAEYRLEVFRGAAFRAHKKLPQPHTPFNWNREDTLWESFGYRTMREGVGSDVIEVGKLAVEAVGYDFGAVDIIRSEAGELYVLEVNSAPGLEDAGLEKYATRIEAWANTLAV